MHKPTNIDWTKDAKAIALLASIRSNPPECVGKFKVFGCTREDWYEYVGDRVDALIAIRDEYGQRALEAALAGNRPAMTAWSVLGTVHEVIDDALSAASERMVA